MGRTPRDAARVDRRRQLVAESYLQCRSQADIARDLGVSQATISNDVRAIRRQWRESALRDFDEAVGMELAKLDRLEREAWIGWNRSLEPTESTKVMQNGAAKRAEKTTRQQGGDPRFLEQLQRCIAARRALLGLDAPVRIAPTSPNGAEAYHAHVMTELMRLAEETQQGPLVIDPDYVARTVDQVLVEQEAVGKGTYTKNSEESS